MKKLDYIPNMNNVDSFITYKFSLMPDKVINDDSYDSSFPFLFMNNEFLKLLNDNLDDKNMYKIITPEILVNVRKIVKEGIEFYNSYNSVSQNFSKTYKNEKLPKLRSKFKLENNDLYFAKYLCFKEAYDLELGLDKIYNYDISMAEMVLNTINSVLNPIYSLKVSNTIRNRIIKCLKKDIETNDISTTLDLDLSLSNVNYFKALICSNDILECIKVLFEQDKLSRESVDFCIQLLYYGINAKNNTLEYKKNFIIDEEDRKNFDRESASRLKTKLICDKYK